MQFTGERWIPGCVEKRIEDDHVCRYEFATQFSGGKQVLDIACGSGGGTHLLAMLGNGAHVEGVDCSTEAIEFARSKFKHPALTFNVASIETYCPDKPVDLITCFETIEHVIDEMLVLRNMKAWLKPGGMLLISSPNRPVTSPFAATINDKPTNRFHIREFTPRELAGRLRVTGFVDIQTLGQRPRLTSRIAVVAKLIETSRKLFGRSNPDETATPKVCRFVLRTPRYFVLMAKA